MGDKQGKPYRGDDRRSAPRFDAFKGEIRFEYPKKGGQEFSMRVRDISASGISFVLDVDLPGLDIGRILERATVKIGKHEIRGDLVVMHMTDDGLPQPACGAMFYPRRDADILELRAVLDELRGSIAKSA